MKKSLPPKLNTLAQITTIKHLQYLQMSPFFSWNWSRPKFTFSHQSTEYFVTKVLRIIRMFSANVRCTFMLNWGLQLFRCCSLFFCDLLDDLPISFWSHFGKPDTPGKVHHYSKFSPFGGHTATSWIPKVSGL